MSAPPLDAQERQQLCDLFAELGPDAPTLCEGWTTEDLAAHLVVRERDPRAVAGILAGGAFGGYFARLTDQLMQRAKQDGWGKLVDRVRTGPPIGPFKVPVLREQINLPEYFIHHEDVRRANDRGPRTGPAVAALDDALWGQLRRTARFQLRRVPRAVGAELIRPDRPSSPIRARSAAEGGGTATITGRPGELVLYLSGRKDAAEVALTGSPEAVAAVEQSRLGI